MPLVACLLFMTVAAGPAAALAPPPTPHEIHVAPEGDDAAAGTREAPLATPLAARDAARAWRAAGNDGPIEIVLSGTHYLPEGLTFGPEDSGRTGALTTWRSDRTGFGRRGARIVTEPAHLIGGLPLGPWQDEGDGVWSAPWPEGHTVRELFQDGRPLTRARIPKEGYFTIAGEVEGNEREAFRFAPDAFDPAGIDFSHAEVFVWPEHNWFSFTRPIEGVAAETRTVRLAEPVPNYRLTAGSRYRLGNARAFLTEAGEYTVDANARRVFVRPFANAEGEDPAVPSSEEPDPRFVGSTAAHLLHFAGAPGAPVQHIRFEEVNLSVAQGDIVRMEHAAHLALDACRMENSGVNGVTMQGHARNNSVTRSEIRQLGQHGVVLQGLPPGQPDVNSHHRVHSNHIHHGGRLVGHGCGVYISQSGHNAITHNEIHHMPRYGTSIKGVRFHVLRAQVPGVTWENRHDFLHSRSNVLAYNRIHRVNLDSQDTGAMEAWGPGRDNLIDHNLIHDAGNDEFNLQMGIYLDDAADYFTVTNNIIHSIRGTQYVVAIYTKGIHNRFENNVFVMTPPMDSALKSFFMADERADHHVYRRNIFYFDEVPAVIQHFTNWDDDRVTASDFNLFWHTDGGAFRFSGRNPARSLAGWRELFGGRYDRHSLVADPLFVDPDNHDFRLSPESPAHRIGIVSIDARIGLLPDVPARLREGALGEYPPAPAAQ